MMRARRAAEIVALIRSAGHESALVGGVAVSLRARERFTRDLAYAVAVSTDRETEALGRSMQGLGFKLVMVVEQVAKQLIATLRFQDPQSSLPGPGVDLICASSGLEKEIVAAASLLEIAPGISLPVARIPHLLAMKVLSVSAVRDQDGSDLRALVRVASAQDLVEAREAVALIVARGFQRGKDLVAGLEAIIAAAS